MCVCGERESVVCVCVCVRERERVCERAGGYESVCEHARECVCVRERVCV